MLMCWKCHFLFVDVPPRSTLSRLYSNTVWCWCVSDDRSRLMGLIVAPVVVSVTVKCEILMGIGLLVITPVITTKGSHIQLLTSRITERLLALQLINVSARHHQLASSRSVLCTCNSRRSWEGSEMCHSLAPSIVSSRPEKWYVHFFFSTHRSGKRVARLTSQTLRFTSQAVLFCRALRKKGSSVAAAQENYVHVIKNLGAVTKPQELVTLMLPELTDVTGCEKKKKEKKKKRNLPGH